MKGSASGSYASIARQIRTTRMCVVLLLLLMINMMPRNGPDCTEMMILVLRDILQSSGRMPKIAISALLADEQKWIRTYRASSGRLGAFLATPSPSFCMKYTSLFSETKQHVNPLTKASFNRIPASISSSEKSSIMLLGSSVGKYTSARPSFRKMHNRWVLRPVARYDMV